MKNWHKYKIIDFCYVTDFVANGSFASLRENVSYKKDPDYAVLVRLTDFTKKWSKDFVYVSKSAYDFLKKSSLLPNDLIMSNVGEPGIVFLVPDLKQPMTLGPNSILIRPDSKLSTSKFLYLYFLSKKGREKIDYISTGAAQKKFNKTEFRDLEISLPSLSEQKEIVAILDKAFDDIAKAKENAEQNLKNTKELFESYLQSVFSTKGKDWEQKTLGDIYQIGSSRRVLKSQWRTEGVPFYRGREITRLANDGSVNNELFISEDHYKELLKQSGVPKSGDIVITAIGTIGNLHIVREEDKFYFKDASVLWMKRITDVDSEFIKFWLKSTLFFNQLDKDNGATVDTLTIKKLQSVDIYLPKLREQEEIVKKLNLLLGETKKLETIYQNKIKDLEELKKSILQKAFNGELKSAKV